MTKYLWGVVVAADQLLNAVLLGYPDETFSARSYRKALAGQWFWRLLSWLIDQVFFWEVGHCQKSYENEEAGRHRPQRRADADLSH